MIRLYFPTKMDGSLVPHSTRIVTRDLRGNMVQDSMNWTSSKYLQIDSRFDHQAVDTSVSVTYCREQGGACKEYGITSVSDFIKHNAKPGDIFPE